MNGCSSLYMLDALVLQKKKINKTNKQLRLLQKVILRDNSIDTLLKYGSKLLEHPVYVKRTRRRNYRETYLERSRQQTAEQEKYVLYLRD